jgi:hypothetical protein
MASGKGFEPLFTGSEPAVLPIRRPRKNLVKTEGLEPTTFSFVARCSHPLSYVSIDFKKCTGKDSNLHSFTSDSFRLPAFTIRRPVLKNTAIQLSNIKNKRSGLLLDLPMIQA